MSLAIAACGSEVIDPVDAGDPDAGNAPIDRVMLVVQNSFSMSATDPDERRKALVEEAFAALSGRIAVIVFSDGWRESGYVEDVEDPQIQFLLQRMDNVENLGVLDGALLRAKEVIVEARAAETDPSIRWSIVVLTDGFPTPSCTAGSDISPICETPRSEWAMYGVDVNDPSVYYGFEGAGGAYNQRTDAIARAEELAAFARTHAILLYSEAIVGQPIEMSLGLNRTECAAFSALLAQAGGGNVVVEDGAAIDWNVLLQ